MVIFFTVKLPLILIFLVGLLAFLHWMFDDVFTYNSNIDEKVDRLIGEGAYDKICESIINICFVLCLILVVYIIVDVIALILLM